MSFNFGAPKTTGQQSPFSMSTPANTSSGQPQFGLFGGATQSSAPAFSLPASVPTFGASPSLPSSTPNLGTGTGTSKPAFNLSPMNSTAFSLGGTPSFGMPANPSTTSMQPSNTGATPKTQAFTGFSLATTSASGGFSLGGNTQSPTTFSLGSAPQPASTGFTLGSTSQPASTGFTLGSTSQPASTGFTLGTTSQSATTGFSLGSTSQPASTGLSLGTTSQPASTSFSLGTTTQAPTGFSLGSTTQPASTTGFSVGGTTQASTSFSLGTTQTVTAFSVGTTPAASTAGFSLGTASTAGFSLGTSGTTTSLSSTIPTTAAITTQALPATSQPNTQSSSVQPTNFQQLVDLINNWTVSLENQEKQFLNQANEITVWDNMLTNQSTKLVKLYDMLERKEKEQVDIENELDFLLSQQKELEDCLVPLEQELQSAEVLSSMNNEREPIYKAAQEIDNQVKQMSGDIKEIVNNLNKANSKKDSDDDLDTICRILNCHMTALQYIEHNAENLSATVTEVNEEHSRFLTAANDNTFMSSFRK